MDADEVDGIVAAWRRERPDLDVAPLQVLSRLDRLAGVLAERRAKVFAAHGLRKHEFDVLSALRREGDPFRLTAGELAARTHVTSGTMTSRIDGLTERGLVTRAPDLADGRIVRVALTASGREAVDTAFRALLGAEHALLTPLRPDDREPLAAALRTLLLAASASGGSSEPGIVGAGREDGDMSVWDALVGQGDTVAVLREAAAAAAGLAAGEAAPAGLMTHAWLFTGPAGSGRSVAAQAFAAALQCERREDRSELGCGECSQCRTVAARTHPDVRSVVPQGLSIGVAEMRETVGRASRRPQLGRWQVIVIEDADRLTEQASNAMLKAIEEPPPRTVILLCVPSLHPDDVMVTIRSRCRLVTLRTPPADAVAGVLEREGLDAETAAWAAAAGQGHVGRSRRLARDADARDRRAEVLKIPASLSSLRACLVAADHLVDAAEAEAKSLSADRDAVETESLQVALGQGATGRGVATAVRGSAGVLKDLERRQKSRATRTQRDALDRALVDLAAFYRDVLLVQRGSRVAPAHPDFAADVRRVAAAFDEPAVLRCIDAILACRQAIDENVKPRIAVEAMTSRLRLPA